jgi:hypothetical protein
MIKPCASCGTEYRTSHPRISAYCSRPCMAHEYKRRMAGSANPNYRALPARTCACCGGEYRSYIKTRRYCSKKCAGSVNVRNIKVDPRAPRRRQFGPFGTRRLCESCSIPFFWRGSRRYCPPCLLTSTKRTGKKGRRAMRDFNQDDIEAGLRAAGAHVLDISRSLRGIPDLLVSMPGGPWVLLEVKNPENSYGRKGLSPAQKRFVETWRGGPVAVVRSVAEALRAVGVEVEEER